MNVRSFVWTDSNAGATAGCWPVDDLVDLAEDEADELAGRAVGGRLASGPCRP